MSTTSIKIVIGFIIWTAIIVPLCLACGHGYGYSESMQRSIETIDENLEVINRLGVTISERDGKIASLTKERSDWKIWAMETEIELSEQRQLTQDAEKKLASVEKALKEKQSSCRCEKKPKLTVNPPFKIVVATPAPADGIPPTELIAPPLSSEYGVRCLPPLRRRFR